MAATKLPGLKPIPTTGIDKELSGSLKAMYEALAIRLGQAGDELDRAITVRELIDSGLATQLTQTPFNPNTGATGFAPLRERPGDVVVPPAPTVLTAAGLFTDALLSWNQSTNTAPYGNHAFTEIWRSQAEDLSGAVLVGTTNAFIYTDKGLEYDFTYYYWVRFVSDTNTPGPWSNMASATTIENIGATMIALSETLAALPGYNLITTTAAAATVIKQSSSPSARADGSAIGAFDIWFDTDDSQVYTRNAANDAWVAGRDSTLVSVFGATSFTGSTLTAAMASAQQDVITVTNAQNATASSLSTLSSTVGGHTSSISSLSTTTANLNGDVNAMFVLQVATESNGSKSAAGMVIGSNANSGSGAQSYVQFQADKFAIWSGSSSTAPFIVDSGVVYIDQARIKDAAILDAKIGTLNGGKIIADTITATQIDAATITATQIATDTITATQIAGNTITAGQIAAGTITADEIEAGTITSTEINVTNLILPLARGTVSNVGPFNNNTMRLIQIASIGTAAGIYSGYVRVFGGNGQVKTLSIVAGDATFGGAGNQLRNDTAYTDGTAPSIPTADTGAAQYHSGQSQYWSAIDRFDSTNEMVQKDFMVRKTSGTGATMHIYILAQGDGNSRYLSSVQYAFQRFSEA